MRLVAVRRISQGFFLTLLIWSCLVTTVGDRWHELRGWPVGWMLELDPLVGLATLLTTRTVYKGLIWGTVTLGLTAILGRFFCGWLCPMGTLQQMVGVWGDQRRRSKARAAGRRPHPAQQVKYWLLVGLLTMAAAELVQPLVAFLGGAGWLPLGVIVAAGGAAVRWGGSDRVRTLGWMAAVAAAGGLILGVLFPGHRLVAGGLQTGLLDPIPLVYRSVSLVILPLLAPGGRSVVAEGGLVTGAVFLTVLALSAWRPRFYCRYVCPLGALMGLTARWSPWRMGRRDAGADACTGCGRCDRHCEGACAPANRIQWAECVLCYNCPGDCPEGIIGYGPSPSTAGEAPGPDLSRRALITAGAVGAVALPMARLGDPLGVGWRPDLVRPPGALTEATFLDRCIKCGLCMRVCPTNVIQPAVLSAGVEGLWTPRLDFRLGTSGCQHNCIACGHVCPTGAIRPLMLDERMGRGAHTDAGPIRIGTAFVDRGRCLPWAMGTPCIVCQENCPVSPKAITTRAVLAPVAGLDRLTVSGIGDTRVMVPLPGGGGSLGSGDYYLSGPAGAAAALRITAAGGGALTLAGNPADAGLTGGADAAVLVRLQQPFTDPRRCIGCGVCQHECPVGGRAAIRVTSENESRSRGHALLAAGSSQPLRVSTQKWVGTKE